MTHTFFTPLKQFLHKLIHVGIYPDMPYVESRYTKLLNVLNWLGLCFMLGYAILNLTNGRYFLTALNMFNMVDATAVLILHRLRMYLSARLVMVGCRIVIYTISGLYFHNGAEYFLLTLLITTIIIFDNRWIRTFLCSLIILACISVVLFPQPPLLGVPVMEEQAIVNMVLAIGLIIGTVTFFKSIQYGYQQEVEKQRQALIELNRDKQRMFSILAHDIRSPMATLENLLQIFYENLLTRTEQMKTTQLLKDQVIQLGTTMDDLLNWSARGMQGMETVKTSFLLYPLIKELFQFFDLIIKQKQLEVEMCIDKELILSADRDQIAVVMRNLLSNACKFSHRGGHIRIVAVEKNNSIEVFIEDEGVGMDENRINRLFTSSNSSVQGTAGEKGYGLGLMLCAEFVRLNEGNIAVKSRLGEGSIFTVRLPQ
ncbi:ATPase/histidine kinase/DNA gyrase B/HSP90 domain protein [Sphingobacterium spiritivorum ATCC 33300]|uniref:histidine kinase n=1 Tax=Sphingobacterium spiritivorum ATCC 33300 TaxID=525372 RepID=C2FX61_SPHSI|nr:HAMP domain-containing sensor histidine kinase [Sphingobacterium spiritivorum]EEI92502.1 ATPase/histidine kinase/DNA gyrase B/HSP90 domain protein [Sphingobacterium spiritivorum ATCC 33300]QQS94508.1 HAMP domain-containing histidine kinase [Sphingobacterium spiritivorum]